MKKQPGTEHWKTVSSKYLFRRPWLTVRHEEVELPDRRRIPDYYILEYPEWVNMIAITANGQFIFVHQYRHGLRQSFYEIPAGVCEKSDHSPMDAAKRELQEETGFGGGEWTEFMTLSANPASQTNLTHTFLARNVIPVSAQNLDPGEDLTIHLLSPDEVLELLIDLGASDEQLDCPFVYASAKNGVAALEISDEMKDMKPLFETILDYIPAPEGDPEAPTQVLISTIDYNEYVGRIGVGKVDNGTIAVNQDMVVVNHHDPDKQKKVKISKLYEFDGLQKVEVKEASIGAIVAISGISDISIGDTLCSPENPTPIPFQKISEPTISMDFVVNDSPFAGQEGKYVTSRHLRDRLMRELNTDVSLRVEDTENMDAFKVSGRGELHLSVLIENMRREGYEFAVSKAEVLYHKDENGKLLEPMEIAYIDVPDEYTGVVIDKLSQRKGELQTMGAANGGYTRLEFRIPSRGLIGYRGDFLTDTKGNGIMNTAFDGYAPYKGDIQYRKQGSLIAYETGESVTYGLYSAQERGTLFIGAGEKVYSGMVIGENAKTDDIEVNVCKTKHLTNTRSSSADDALRLTPPTVLSLEQAIDFIDTDELLEVTPESLRIRKKILDPKMRKRVNR